MMVGYPSHEEGSQFVSEDAGGLDANEGETGTPYGEVRDASEQPTPHDDASAPDARAAYDAAAPDDGGPGLDGSAPDTSVPDTSVPDASASDADVAMEPPTLFDDGGTPPVVDAGTLRDAGSSDAGAKDAGVKSDGGLTPPTCGGARALNACWYLGAYGETCTETCKGHGGFDPHTITLVGTSSQGGSWDNCRQALNALGFLLFPLRGYLTDGYSNGCNMFYTTITYWLDDPTPPFNENRSSPYARIACGCNK